MQKLPPFGVNSRRGERKVIWAQCISVLYSHTLSREQINQSSEFRSPKWFESFIYYSLYMVCTVGWGKNTQYFCLPYLKTWFFYVLVFNAELNGTIRILWFCRTIIDLLCPILALLCQCATVVGSLAGQLIELQLIDPPGNTLLWIIAPRKHKILIVPVNSAFKSTLKNQVFKYSGQKHWAFAPHPAVYGG